MTAALVYVDTLTLGGGAGTVKVEINVRGDAGMAEALSLIATLRDLSSGTRPEPVEAPEPEPVAEEVEEARAVPPARASSPPRATDRAPHKGTHRQVILAALAEQGGTYRGAGAALAREIAAGTGRNEKALKFEVGAMGRDGLLTHEGRRHDGTWTLTGDGWSAADRKVHHAENAVPAGKPETFSVDPEPRPPLEVVGPIAHRPFDPDAARAAAAGAL